MSLKANLLLISRGTVMISLVTFLAFILIIQIRRNGHTMIRGLDDIWSISIYYSNSEIITHMSEALEDLVEVLRMCSRVKSKGLGFSSCAAPLTQVTGQCLEGVGQCLEGVGQCPESDIRCVGIPEDVREQEIRLIQTKSELERKQWRTTRGRGGGVKSIGFNPKTSRGRRERTQVRRRKE
ncbi:hypothetical protein C8R48DRAFT_669544 [Suillus tomentosus]|nr:hypothetical protein C8R48DRAFT_669544 [Suillus tomentosus]